MNLHASDNVGCEDKLDDKESCVILDYLFQRFSQLEDACAIIGLLYDEYNELKMDHPLLSDGRLVDLIAEECPEIFEKITTFVKSVFDETNSFNLNEKSDSVVWNVLGASQELL